MNGLRIACWSVLVVGTALVVASSLPYLVPGGEHPFLLERPELTARALWRGALTLHVACGVFALPTGAFLLSRRALRRWPKLHPRLGRLYASVLLLGMVPTGTYLAFFAKGGVAAGSGFFLSGVFAAGCVLLGAQRATQRRLRAHQEWMLRAYAQLASAITFRVAHVFLQLTPMAYEDLYVTSLWVSVLGNAALVELAIVWSHKTREPVVAPTSTRSHSCVQAS